MGVRVEETNGSGKGSGMLKISCVGRPSGPKVMEWRRRPQLQWADAPSLSRWAGSGTHRRADEAFACAAGSTTAGQIKWRRTRAGARPGAMARASNRTRAWDGAGKTIGEGQGEGEDAGDGAGVPSDDEDIGKIVGYPNAPRRPSPVAAQHCPLLPRTQPWGFRYEQIRG